MSGSICEIVLDITSNGVVQVLKSTSFRALASSCKACFESTSPRVRTRDNISVVGPNVSKQVFKCSVLLCRLSSANELQIVEHTIDDEATKHALDYIRTVQTVHAICSDYAPLVIPNLNTTRTIVEIINTMEVLLLQEWLIQLIQQQLCTVPLQSFRLIVEIEVYVVKAVELLLDFGRLYSVDRLWGLLVFCNVFRRT